MFMPEGIHHSRRLDVEKRRQTRAMPVTIRRRMCAEASGGVRAEVVVVTQAVDLLARVAHGLAERLEANPRNRDRVGVTLFARLPHPFPPLTSHRYKLDLDHGRLSLRHAPGHDWKESLQAECQRVKAEPDGDWLKRVISAGCPPSWRSRPLRRRPAGPTRWPPTGRTPA